MEENGVMSLNERNNSLEKVTTVERVARVLLYYYIVLLFVTDL